ncbi:Glutathione S-transferase, C-terminal [Caulobacteraceae bacterium]
MLRSWPTAGFSRTASGVRPLWAEFGREYIAGDFTIADTITGHAVIMSRRLGADFGNFPNLSAYADRLEARPAFKAAEAA